MYKLIKQENNARRGEFITPHGTVQMPAFMNVATCGAIKGAVSAFDLKELHCQVQLCNTYHLHLRPTDRLLNNCKVFINLQIGTVLYLQTVEDFKYFHLQNYAISKKKVFISIHI